MAKLAEIYPVWLTQLPLDKSSLWQAQVSLQLLHLQIQHDILEV